MREYELMLMLNPEADEDRVNAALDRLRSFIGERGGEFKEGEHWGKRKLAYKIGTFTEGNYLLADVKMEAEPAKELENTLKFTEDVIRYMLLRKDRDRAEESV